VDVLIFTSLFLDFVMDPDFVQISVKRATETPAMIRHEFEEESMSRTRLPERHARFRADRKKARQAKSTVKSMLIIFFDIKGIAHKEFVLASLTVYMPLLCHYLQQLSVKAVRHAVDTG
jgi:hypothetical protein